MKPRGFTPPALPKAARLLRRFIEDYHERLEEKFIFPAFEKKRQQADLVKVLRAQHDAGRRLTDVILREASADHFKKDRGRDALTAACTAFIRMYRPHEAREDTVLFPAFRRIVSRNEYDSLGEQFENKEHELFGEDGFEKFVDEVAGLEKALNLYELSSFTPR